MLGNEDMVVWLTPHAAVERKGGIMMSRRGWGQLDESCFFRFTVDGKQLVALARSPEHLLEICDVVVRLLAASVVRSVILHKIISRDGVWIHAASLAYLTEQRQSLKVLTMRNLEMHENHCRVLGAYSRPELEIELRYCKLTRLEQAFWQKSLDAIRARPSLIVVILTIWFSRMGCTETVV
jgi:hypothetical protein